MNRRSSVARTSAANAGGIKDSIEPPTCCDLSGSMTAMNPPDDTTLFRGEAACGLDVV